MVLKEYFEKNNKVALAFSGGTDSSFLLYEAKSCHADVKPYFIKTQFQPQFELDDAKKVSDFVGVELTVIEKDILSCKEIVKNSEARCYYCKKYLFETLIQQAKQDGYSVVIDGTNASDNVAERAGMKALSELNVQSPLRECGIGKLEVRRRSKEIGLFTYAKKSYSCLATRIPTNVEIVDSNLEKVERSENLLSEIGLENFRVRNFGSFAKIQVEEKQFAAVAQYRAEIMQALKPYFNEIYLDLTPRDNGE